LQRFLARRARRFSISRFFASRISRRLTGPGSSGSGCTPYSDCNRVRIAMAAHGGALTAA